MKKKILSLLLMLPWLLLPTACEEEHDDVRPGLYAAQEVIETFPGDTVTVSGTVSNYVGLSSVTLSCEAWGINQVYDLSAQEPVVFNYNYRLVVPDDATFEQNLDITVCDKNGLDNRKTVLLKFLPDMTVPVFTASPASQVSVDFDTSTGKAVWPLEVRFTDDRALQSVRLQIPVLMMDETVELSGREGSLLRTIEFTEMGNFPVYLTVTDESGNQADLEVEIVAMLSEDEDPIQDYAQMYVVDASENPDDYINGYYRYMDRMGEYQYQGSFYAATDGAQAYFVPTKSMDGDLYGVSPYSSSKLMNKNGYVVPVTFEQAGRYGIWIDLQAHTYSIWPLEIDANACTEALWMSGTGFSFGEWGSSDEMTQTSPYHYEVETEITDYTGDRQYYFYTANWARVFRADAEGNWWFESASGTCIIFETDYRGPVRVTYDTASPWATIKKITE